MTCGTCHREVFGQAAAFQHTNGQCGTIGAQIASALHVPECPAWADGLHCFTSAYVTVDWNKDPRNYKRCACGAEVNRK